jgi:hypothetical protein
MDPSPKTRLTPHNKRLDDKLWGWTKTRSLLFTLRQLDGLVYIPRGTSQFETGRIEVRPASQMAFGQLQSQGSTKKKN